MSGGVLSEVNVKVAFRRYTIVFFGPCLLFTFAYYVFTMSCLFTAWFFVPIAVFEYIGAIATFKVVSLVNQSIHTRRQSWNKKFREWKEEHLVEEDKVDACVAMFKRLKLGHHEKAIRQHGFDIATLRSLMEIDGGLLELGVPPEAPEDKSSEVMVRPPITVPPLYPRPTSSTPPH